MQTTITPKHKRRIYKLHYQLRKKGNKVVTCERYVIKRAKELSSIENKYCNELIAFGYGVCDDMFNQ